MSDHADAFIATIDARVSDILDRRSVAESSAARADPMLAHGGLSLLEIIVPFIEISR